MRAVSRTLCVGGFQLSRKDTISYPPKRQLDPPTIWVLYIHEKMEQSKGRRRLEATQPGQLLEAQSNTQTGRLQGPPAGSRRGIARNGDVPMWHNAARPRSLQSTNVRRKDDKKGVMTTSYRSIFSQHNSPPNSSIPVSKMKTTGHLLQLDTPAVGRKDEHIRVCIRMIEVAALNGRSNDQ